MKAVTFSFQNEWIFNQPLNDAQLVLCFGHKSLITPENARVIKTEFPKAEIISCSTSGEIIGEEVLDHTITGTAIHLDKTPLEIHRDNIQNHEDSLSLGKEIGFKFNQSGLKHVFLISDGHLINGSDLLEGLTSILPDIIISGGLAGDGANFESTLVGQNDEIKEGNVVAIGYYGDSIQVGHASLGGWDEFGPERYITKSKDNVLLELDDEPALELYKEYLGEKAEELPSSALLFPLSLKEDEDSEESVVRTVLTIDDNSKSMTFAGNMPEDGVVRLMKANFEKLIEASSDAAELSIQKFEKNNIDLALYISCVGRKLILDQRISEEVKAAQNIIGQDVPSLGFYSYGEVSPQNDSVKCSLHNQTMTITTYKEV